MLKENVINDLNNCSNIKTMTSDFGGSDIKMRALIDDEHYMLKFQDFKTRTDWTSYGNSIYSEYIACRIFQSVGIKTQETYLCKIKDDYVVACKIFTDKNTRLVEIAEASTHPDVRIKFGRNPSLDDVYKTFYNHPDIDFEASVEHFWNVFVMDALLANFDRHSGNYGFLMDDDTGKMKPSPVYDCASCLYPTLPEHELFDKLTNGHKEISHMTFSLPRSVYKDETNQRVFYHEFLQSLKNEDCNQALKRIYPKIDLNYIKTIIDNTPNISDLRKEFYNTVIEDRYNNILTPAYELLMEADISRETKIDLEI